MHPAAMLKKRVPLVFALAVLAGAARANELWVAPARNPGDRLIADFAVAQKKTHFGFGVPDNFNGFTRATVLLIGSRDQEIRYDLTLSISQNLGSARAFVTELRGLAATVLKGQLLELDVSAIFIGAPALQPGTDYVSLSVEIDNRRSRRRGEREDEDDDDRNEGHSKDAAAPHALLFGLRFQYEGSVGPQGPAGPKGDKGDTGPQGPIGPPGDSVWKLDGANAFATNAGNIGVGVEKPAQKLDVNGALKLSGGDACEAESAGSLRFNATTREFEGFDGEFWVSLNTPGRLGVRGQVSYTAPGPAQFVVPAGVRCLTLELWGPGGGGGGGATSTQAGGGGGGGGAGAHIRISRRVSPGEVLALGVGQGGTGGPVGGPGGDGEATTATFAAGLTFVAPGGQHGSPGTSAGAGGAGGAGGTATAPEAETKPGAAGAAGEFGEADVCEFSNGNTVPSYWGGPGGAGGAGTAGLYAPAAGGGGTGGNGRSAIRSGPSCGFLNRPTTPGAVGETGKLVVTW